MKTKTTHSEIPMDHLPFSIVSCPSVGPIRFSVAGSGERAAGNLPARRILIKKSISSFEKRPVIRPRLVIVDWMFGADSSVSSNTMPS